MRPSILIVLLGTVLTALPAWAQQQRPSINSIDAAQKRTNAAICAKADADGDSYRPFVCEPRCDCLAGLLEGSDPPTCTQPQPGNFTIGFPAPAGSCGGEFCVNSTLLGCGLGGTCPSGEVCVSSCAFNICFNTCRRPCTEDAACPGTIAELLGVAAADSPQVVSCRVGTETRKINSNDALQCLTQVQAAGNTCQ